MKDELTISKITTEVVEVPLEQPFITHLHTVNAIHAIRVKVTLKNGMIGIGAATPNEVVTGDNIDTLKIIIEEVIAPRLIGSSLANVEPLMKQLHTVVVANGPAKAAVDIAIYDLLTQIYHVSLNHLLGGSKQSMATDYTISIGKPAEMVEQAKKTVQRGFTALKIKLGDHSIDEDVESVKQIAQAVGSDVALHLDVNQGWSYKQALQAFKMLADVNLNLDFIEQPLPANQLRDLALLRQQSTIPLMLDESVFTPADALRVIKAGAADYVNIKLMKCGGIYEATKINQLCESAGIPCMVGSMIEAPESIAAAAAFANAHANVRFIDLDSVYMIKNDLDLGDLKRVGIHLWHA